MKRFFKAAKFIRKMSQNNNNGNKEDLSPRADRAIRNHVMWSMGAGFIPLPVADFLAVAAVQLDMIRSLSNVYGVDFKETEGKALITSLTGSGLSRVGANALVKMIPGVGSLLGGVSMSILSGASTYALGQVFKTHFSSGGTILDLDTSRFKKYYEEQFEKGKKVAEDIKQEKEKHEKGKDDSKPKDTVSTPPAPNNPPQATEQTPPPPPVMDNVSAPRTVTPSEEKPKSEAPKASGKPDTTSEVVRKLKELAELKDMGIINDEEFAQMKARLIASYK